MLGMLTGGVIRRKRKVATPESIEHNASVIDPWEWGWDAIAAIGQAVGAAGTALAFAATFWLLKVERGRDRAQKDAEDSAQANLVAAWRSKVRSDPSDPNSLRKWGAAIKNGSGLPIYQVQLDVQSTQTLKQGTMITKTRDYESMILEVVPPGAWYLSGNILYPHSQSFEGHPQSAYVLPPKNYTIALRFQDAAGNRWLRTEEGMLVKLKMEEK